jgi:ATP-binding cassette subfamily C protein LapB
MDSDLELKVMKSIFTEAAPNAVILLSTHKPSLLGFVNRIIILDKGQIVFDGPRDEAIAKLTRKAPN